jgi:hypothetical protein
MCEELEDELNEGGRLAMQLAEHLQAMGAAKAEIPVTIDSNEFRVTVEQRAAALAAVPTERTNAHAHRRRRPRRRSQSLLQRSRRHGGRRERQGAH